MSTISVKILLLWEILHLSLQYNYSKHPDSKTQDVKVEIKLVRDIQFPYLKSYSYQDLNWDGLVVWVKLFLILAT